VRSSRLIVLISLGVLSFGSPAFARRRVAADTVTLKDWAVPFEQIRSKVTERDRCGSAERSLHPR